MSPDLFFALTGGLLGAITGSFLNVCISRLPAGLSVVSPRSRCPKCETPIAWYDNVPILSWLILRGRCRSCAEPISVMYPLVELVVALLWAWMAWRHGVTFEALRWALFGTLLLGIAMTDAREFIIPHEFTFGGMAVGLIASFAGGLGGAVDSMHGAIFGAGLVYLIGMLGEFAFKKEAMGGGDVAMMAMVGAFLGWPSVLATIFFGAVIGVLLHVITLGFRRTPGSPGTPGPTAGSEEFDGKSREQLQAEGYLPFGVSLAIAAALIALIVGPDRVAAWFQWYAAFVGL